MANPRKRKARVLEALRLAAESAAQTIDTSDDILVQHTADVAVASGKITKQEAAEALAPLNLKETENDGEEKQTTTKTTKKTTKKRTTKKRPARSRSKTKAKAKE